MCGCDRPSKLAVPGVLWGLPPVTAQPCPPGSSYGDGGGGGDALPPAAAALPEAITAAVTVLAPAGASAASRFAGGLCRQRRLRLQPARRSAGPEGAAEKHTTTHGVGAPSVELD